MSKTLVIVESPAKARTISKFLSKEYKVLASMGHIRDLPKSRLGFDPENNFTPEYEVDKSKTKIIKELKSNIDKNTNILLATDEDREGEAISWHLIAALKIQKNPIKRIVFHEITKSAIEKALKSPREINQDLVDAQQARRVLDRAVGYKLSPLLWKKIKGGLSAGRVQSVAVRIIIDRENEIRAFKPEEFWNVKANFIKPKFQAELKKVNNKPKDIKNEKSAKKIEKSAKNSNFLVKSITEKEGSRKPPTPFTTSTLQQEAARKLGFSVKQTMVIAQQLYEGNVKIPGFSGGLITYMRTDSVNLSEQALKQSKKVIQDIYGKNYLEIKKYKTKTKGAQEAHEAIRPTDLCLKPSQIKNHLDSRQFKLYDLIWKRTLASQMQKAKIANTIVKIEAGEKRELEFEIRGQKIVFPGFMKVYTEGADDPEEQLNNLEKTLPDLKEKQELNLQKLLLEQNFTKPPARYTEASLVKKLEAEGIGRPSTYAPTISTIQSREYIEKTPEKKLKPTDIGEIVNDFLLKYFSDIVDLGFTAKMEQEFDDIAHGKIIWTKLMQKFYQPFASNVQEKDESLKKEDVIKVRVLGNDPKTKKQIIARMGRYGPLVQIGENEDEDKKFAAIPKNKSISNITLEEALALFTLPRILGKDEDGNEIMVNIGRFGPYVKVEKNFFSIRKLDPYKITLEEAKEVIKEGKERKSKKVIKVFEKEKIEILNGRYGPYIKNTKKNYKIPKSMKPEDLKLEDCQKIIAEAKKK